MALISTTVEAAPTKGFHLRRGSDSKSEMIPSFTCFLFASTTGRKKKTGGQAQYKAVGFWNQQSYICFLALEPGTNESHVHVIFQPWQRKGVKIHDRLLSTHSARVYSGGWPSRVPR